MKSFPLLIKPTSADCNLRCRYCFYLDRTSLYPETVKHRISAATLERLVRTYMAIDQPQYAFIWQGGEPSLMGVEFFRRVVDLQMKWGSSGASVANALQTNATLINDELAHHLSEFNFLVGVSLDGPAHIHDRYRCHNTGTGSFPETMKGIDALKRNYVQFNILSLVTDVNVARGKEVYRYLRDNGFMFHQYIPCVEFESDGEPEPFSIKGEEWGDFLCEIFDEWISWDAGSVSVRFFDSVLSSLLNSTNRICHMASDCRHYLLVEYNGDVYPCDFFVEPKYRLGNIMVDTWEEMYRSGIYVDFGRMKRRRNQACQSCPYGSICEGDCPKHRFYGRRDPQQLSWLCEGYKRFFRHALPRLTGLAERIREDRQLTSVDQGGSKPPVRRPGRNEPCPCGSGRKYKRCCGS